MNQHVITIYKELRAEQLSNVQIIAICRRFLKIVWPRPHGEIYNDLMIYAQEQELATVNSSTNQPVN